MAAALYAIESYSAYSTFAVVLGLQQEEYTVCEGDRIVTVCLELISGQLASTVELSANLSTQDSDAQGGTWITA